LERVGCLLADRRDGLERLNQDLTHRAWVVRIVPNRAAGERLMMALPMEQSEEWVSGRHYLKLK
jgi:hypothetical protein